MNNNAYQTPPEEILEWAEADLPPIARINTKGSHMIFLERNRYITLKELYESEMKLAGIRINPRFMTRSRASYYTGIKIKETVSENFTCIIGLPDSARIFHIKWSPDENKLAFSVREEDGLYLWVLDIHTGEAHRASDIPLNSVLASPFIWNSDSRALYILVKTEHADKLENQGAVIPPSPVIIEGHKTPSQHRTYQDLLRDSTDEANFKKLALSGLVKIDFKGKAIRLDEAMIVSMGLSPDGRYLLYTTLDSPFSYQVPYHKFPNHTNVLNLQTSAKTIIGTTPLQDQLPKGFMAVHNSRRLFQWRNDRDCELVFCRALDDGDPGKDVPYRDGLYLLTPPFTGEPVLLLKTVNRFNHVIWSSFGHAVAVDYWYDNRNSKTYLFYPENEEIKILFDRDVQDRYGDPGSFVTEKNNNGRSVLGGNNEFGYLTGEGYQADGIHPFLDKINLENGVKTRLWEAENNDELCRLAAVMNLDEKKLVIRRETSTEFPNYFWIHWDKPHERNFLTAFENPFSGLQDIRKEIIYYKREDGTELHATLYLPPDSSNTPGKKYPMLMWAYPEEYTDGDLAGQVTSVDQEFTFPWYGSPVFWVRKGYAVLDEVSFPIIGSSSNDMNDTFIEQLQDNALAAIEAVCSVYPVDRGRVAIGGHSYGAFMTANLLTWTDFFAAGIARSGAYNRSLTPFGFQGEQRTYWETPELYHKMSPFCHADKMKSPLLLIHGQMDSNSGTHTMQTQRYYDALNSMGADVRMVLLPKESHHYRARESILHMLWEQDQWLEKHLSGNF